MKNIDLSRQERTTVYKVYNRKKPLQSKFYMGKFQNWTYEELLTCAQKEKFFKNVNTEDDIMAFSQAFIFKYCRKKGLKVPYVLLESDMFNSGWTFKEDKNAIFLTTKMLKMITNKNESKRGEAILFLFSTLVHELEHVRQDRVFFGEEEAKSDLDRIVKLSNLNESLGITNKDYYLSNLKYKQNYFSSIFELQAVDAEYGILLEIEEKYPELKNLITKYMEVNVKQFVYSAISKEGLLSQVDNVSLELSNFNKAYMTLARKKMEVERNDEKLNKEIVVLKNKTKENFYKVIAEIQNDTDTISFYNLPKVNLFLPTLKPLRDEDIIKLKESILLLKDNLGLITKFEPIIEQHKMNEKSYCQDIDNIKKVFGPRILATYRNCLALDLSSDKYLLSLVRKDNLEGQTPCELIISEMDNLTSMILNEKSCSNKRKMLRGSRFYLNELGYILEKKLRNIKETLEQKEIAYLFNDMPNLKPLFEEYKNKQNDNYNAIREEFIKLVPEFMPKVLNDSDKDNSL